MCEMVFLKNKLQDQHPIEDKPLLLLPQENSVIYHLVDLHTSFILIFDNSGNKHWILVHQVKLFPYI